MSCPPVPVTLDDETLVIVSVPSSLDIAATMQTDPGFVLGVPGQPGRDGKSVAVNATFTVSTDAPSGGQDGDVWFQIL